jgi:hypothetical protein
MGRFHCRARAAVAKCLGAGSIAAGAVSRRYFKEIRVAPVSSAARTWLCLRARRGRGSGHVPRARTPRAMRKLIGGLITTLAVLAPAAPAVARTSLYLPVDLDDQAQGVQGPLVKPRSFTIDSADRTLVVRKVRWRHWGSGTAIGRGRYDWCSYNALDPCRTHDRLRIRVSGRVTDSPCPVRTPLYTSLAIAFAPGRPFERLPLPLCTRQAKAHVGTKRRRAGRTRTPFQQSTRGRTLWGARAQMLAFASPAEPPPGAGVLLSMTSARPAARGPRSPGAWETR